MTALDDNLADFVNSSFLAVLTDQNNIATIDGVADWDNVVGDAC